MCSFLLGCVEKVEQHIGEQQEINVSDFIGKVNIKYWDKSQVAETTKLYRIEKVPNTMKRMSTKTLI